MNVSNFKKFVGARFISPEYNITGDINVAPTNKSFIYSLLLHMAIILGLFIYFKNDLVQNSKKQGQFFHVYIAPSHQNKITHEIHGKSASQKRTNVTPANAGVQTKKQNLSNLVKLIENDIEQHKYYPQDMLAQHQQGNVTVMFDVHPNGQITDVHVINSSHLASLDAAAVNAVTSASPVLGVKKYLHNDVDMQLTLRYEM